MNNLSNIYHRKKKSIDDHVRYPIIKIQLNDLSLSNIKSLALIRPYGTGIKKPLFSLDELNVDDYILIKGKYPKATLKINHEILEIISFNKEFISSSKNKTKAIVGQLSLNTFKGKEKMSFIVDDVLY